MSQPEQVARLPTDRGSWMSPALYWLGFVLLTAGFVINELWRGIVPEPTLFLGGLLLASLLLAFVLCRVLRCAMATALLLLWLLALAYFAGFAACLAVMLVGLAAMGIGSLLVPVEVPARISLCILAGIAILCGIDGWLLPFPIHFRSVYVVTLFVIVFLRWRAIGPMLGGLPRHWSSAVASAPGMAVLTLLAIGAMSTFAWLPTLNFDELAYHLNLPSQLVKLGYYQMNVGSDVWAVSPWAADVLQGIAWMVAGVQARGAVDILWAGLSLILIWKLCEELALPPRLRWLAAALFAAIPTVAYTLSAMQTEGPTAAVIAALALLIQRVREPRRRDLMLVGILFALLPALKISNLMFAGPLGLWLLWRWRGRMPWRTLPFAVLFALVLAGSSYVYAWKLTGNPVLPLFNAVFHSSYFAPTNYHDSRWDKGFHWDIVWRLVFHSGDYMEGGDAAPILVLIGLAGSWLVALFRPVSRPLALVAIAGLLLPLYEIQYSRYAMPSLALLIPAMLCGVPSIAVRRRQSRLVIAGLCVIVLLSLAYINGISWQARAGAVQLRAISGRSAAVNRFAAEREMVRVVEDRYGATARVLMLRPGVPVAAEFGGKAFALSWYDPQLARWAQHANADRTGAAWTTVFGNTGANLLITGRDGISPALMAAIDKNHGSVVLEAGDSLLWKLDGGEPGIARASAAHGVSVTFDATTAPPAEALVDASVTLRCNPDAAGKGHIVVGWQIDQQGHAAISNYGWAHCRQDGTAKLSTHEAVGHKVTAFRFTAQPEPAVDMGLAVMDSHASLRRDLAAERDLSQRARHVLEFKKNKQPLGPAVP